MEYGISDRSYNNHPRITAYYCVHQIEHLLECPEPKNKFIFYPGAKDKFEEIDDKLYTFLELKRKQGISVSTKAYLIK